MARDPPSLVESSELRDLSLQPSTVRSAKITIVHPQLRDLILPIERGRVLYPRGTAIEEQRWTPPSDERDARGSPKVGTTGRTKTFAKLRFTANCLTANSGILACGGQHGELYLTNLPSTPHSEGRLHERFTSSVTHVKPFVLEATLPAKCINNSLLILPGYPKEWNRRQEERQLGFVGRKMRSRDWDEGEDQMRAGNKEEEEEAEVDEDVLMGVGEEDELDEDELGRSPASSVATFPNTVPFLHAPRIPHLNPTRSNLEVLTNRRALSFGSAERTLPSRDRTARQSFSAIIDQPGQLPIQYVSSRRPQDYALSSPGASSSQLSAPPGRPRPSGSSGGDLSKPLKRVDQPRILVSNNDQSVKMFALRPKVGLDNGDERVYWESGLPLIPEPSTSAVRRTANQELASQNERERRFIHRMGMGSRPPLPPPRFGSRFGWDSVGLNDGLASANLDFIQREREAAQRDLNLAEERLWRERETFRRDRAEFERTIGVSVGVSRDISRPDSRSGVREIIPGEGDSDACPSPLERDMRKGQERKLSKVGGVRFKYAVNHSSLSPDLRTMVSVGDSSDVFLFEVIDGGREFRRIGTYQGAATDSGFSTAWSKDGRKFAVASQDGQVNVWDHRSSKSLATFFTTASYPRNSSPSFASDLASSRRSQPSARMEVEEEAYTMDDVWDTNHVLVDPMTGEPRVSRSTSGREAARVVKFSPEGSSRDLMVFTEDNSNIHIVDARTFHTQVIVAVPHLASPPDPSQRPLPRHGVEGGAVGIAGIAFDPSGDWLYSGTEKTVVEWDLRRVGGGEGGVWQMA